MQCKTVLEVIKALTRLYEYLESNDEILVSGGKKSNFDILKRLIFPREVIQTSYFGKYVWCPQQPHVIIHESLVSPLQEELTLEIGNQILANMEKYIKEIIDYFLQQEAKIEHDKKIHGLYSQIIKPRFKSVDIG